MKRITATEKGFNRTNKSLRPLRKTNTDKDSKEIIYKVDNTSAEYTKHRSNVSEILQYSNATPIRCHGGIGYQCCFCADQYPNPADLKKHTIEHDVVTKAKFVKKLETKYFCVKLDITALTCNICSENIEKLESLLDHLKSVHNRKVFTDIKCQILPFKFDCDTLRCFICSNVFNKFKALQEHVNVHYRNYVCNVCDAGFVNNYNLLRHEKIHKVGTFKCDHCEKVFKTLLRKRSHVKRLHTQSYTMYKCGYCNEKFKYQFNKDTHIAKVHGVSCLTLKCQACDATFKKQTTLRYHIMRQHLMERRFKCSHCDMNFFSNGELKDHMVKHTGCRQFQCKVCLKSYRRRKNLTEHTCLQDNDSH